MLLISVQHHVVWCRQAAMHLTHTPCCGGHVLEKEKVWRLISLPHYPHVHIQERCHRHHLVNMLRQAVEGDVMHNKAGIYKRLRLRLRHVLINFKITC
jgi:hypothetical protein